MSAASEPDSDGLGAAPTSTESTASTGTSAADTSADTAPTGLGSLTPVQQRTLAALRRTDDDLIFDADLIADIRTELLTALDDFTDRLDPEAELFITKHRIASVLDCEEHHLVPTDFEWSTANAKGTIAHRAIELMLSWRGEPVPADLVDEAMARLADEQRGIGQWIDSLSPGDDADVRSQTVTRVTQFIENFPPLSKKWAPMTEAAVRWPMSGPITLSGKVDLIFGKPSGRASRKVIVDFKTGRPSARHRQDLGFYALLETLVREVPPRKVATFYLDAGEAQVEDVSERLLRTAVRRTLDGINAIVELTAEQRPPIRRPGVTCRWCPLADNCADGQAWLAARDTDT